jgi:hypothetical protein
VAEDWAEFIGRMCDIAMGDLKKDGELVPILLVDVDEGPVLVPLEKFGPTSVERQERMIWLGTEFAKRGGDRPRRATLIADAYARQLQPGEEAVIHGTLADHPDATHCLTITTRTSTGDFTGRRYPYTREATLDGLQIEFGPPEDDAGTSILLDAFFAGATRTRIPDSAFHGGPPRGRSRQRPAR